MKKSTSDTKSANINEVRNEVRVVTAKPYSKTNQNYWSQQYIE
jgi:hypothetical protein